MKKLLIIVVTIIIVIIVSLSYNNYRITHKNEGQQGKDLSTQDNSFSIKAKKSDKSTADKRSEELEEELLDQSNIKTIDINLYFYDRDKNELIPEERQVDIMGDELESLSIVNELIEGPKSQSLEPVIPSETVIREIGKSEDIITVDLSSDFLESDNLLLARAALVNTLTDLEGVKYVRIYVEGTELTADGQKDGMALGLLSKYPNNLDEIVALDSKMKQQSELREVDCELFFVDCQRAYLLPEVRKITVVNNQYARAIVEELLKGPSDDSKGLYPVFPKGLRLLDIKLIEESDAEKDGLELYFSKEFQNVGAGSAQELTTLGSLVYSLTGLPNIGWIKIYYQDDRGEYIDAPIGNMTLSNRLVKEDFGDLLGKRIKIYFADEDMTSLKPQYRAINKKELGIARKIIQELAEGPIGETVCRKVIPNEVSTDKIRVWMNGRMVVVDLPYEFYQIQSKNNKGLISLYAIVNSLTDPINTDNIDQVLFLMDGKRVDHYNDMVISDPFVRNPALIKE